MHSLTYQYLKRDGVSDLSGTKAARVSVDFVVDDVSLLAQLVGAGGGHGDFMGCFVRGFEIENTKKKVQLSEALKPDTNEGRYLLYICPECGDIGCGAYGAKLRLSSTTAEWYDFAYENGREPGRAVSVGPFTFARADYVAALELAGAA